MTFNIHGGRLPQGGIDLKRTVRPIREVMPDVLALQELDRGLPRSDRMDQPSEISRLIDMEVFFAPTFERSGGAYGIGVAARGLKVVGLERLPQLGDEEPRGALVANGAGFDIVATHLAGQRDVAKAQLQAIADLVRELTGPTLVMGDFNLTRWSLGPLRALGFHRGPYRRTVQHFSLRSQIDFVLVGPGARLERLWTPQSDASDHRPLAAEVAPA
jgi:endonuclease/exonuclease/phosphatase family metal-dependent hydrolase